MMNTESKNNKTVGLVRLHKFMAECGVSSRRQAEQLIMAGRVMINGVVSRELGRKIDPEVDIVQVDQKYLRLEGIERIYLVMNKPRGIMTTVSDPEGRKTVMDLIPHIPQRVFPVGRLDYLSEGLLILTNDGEFAQMIMHPKYEIEKLYEVKVFGIVTAAILKNLQQGIQDKGDFLKPLQVKVIGQLKNKTWLEIRLSEGKNREVRRLCEAVGLTVDKLKRVSIEGLTIQNLPIGHVDFYSKKEILKLLGLNDEGLKVNKVRMVSEKKSIRTEKLVMKNPNAKVAARDEFKRFRKDLYYKTINSGEVKKFLETGLGREKVNAEAPKNSVISEPITKREDFPNIPVSKSPIKPRYQEGPKKDYSSKKSSPFKSASKKPSKDFSNKKNLVKSINPRKSKRPGKKARDEMKGKFTEKKPSFSRPPQSDLKKPFKKKRIKKF